MSLTIIVTGMHRSGTSLTASFLKAIGVNVGDNFFPADRHNIKGYFEDLDFLEFQRTVLADCCPRRERGTPDWGWTESERLDRRKFERYLSGARELIESRDRQANVWGWKDPRTTLMLDFWKRLLPEAKYLLVYRFPWDVVNSIERLNAKVFIENPDYALRIWAYYNRHLLEFYQANSERCLLFNVNAWLKDPNQLVELLLNKLNLEVAELCDVDKFKELYDEQIFKTLDWNDHTVKFLQYNSPQYLELLAELDRFADIPSGFSLVAMAEKISRSIKLTSESRPEEETIGESVESKSDELDENITQETIAIVPKRMKMKDKYESEEIIFSVVIPCYNQGEYILEAISSVEACQERNYEILIINDASTEKLTLKVLDYLRDNGYWVIDRPINEGLAEARNTGVDKARGRYILPLDSDNKIRPEYITKSIEILDKYPEVGVVYGNAEFFGERTGVWEVPEFSINKIAARNYIDACAVFRKKVWEDCGGYDAKIPDKLGYEDWDFWLGAAENGWKFYHVPEILFDYRVRADSMVSACRIPENHERLVHYICAKHLGIYTTNFASILAEKDAALLREESRYERMEMELQKTQVALLQSQEQLERIQGAWEEAQSEVQHIQTAWEEAQSEVQHIQTAWEEAQSELQIAHSVGEKTQEELRRIQDAWEESQQEIERIQTAWDVSQEDLAKTHAAWEEAQLEAKRIHAAWEKSQEQLRQTQAELTETHAAWEESHLLSQQEVQRIHAAWEQAQQEVQQIHGEWEKAQQQVQLTHSEWEQAQQQVQLTHSEWERSQQQVQQIHAEWEKAQQQVQLTHSEWERSQQQVQRIQTAWEEAQQQIQVTNSEWERSQQEVLLTRSEWERSQQQLQMTHSEWERSQQEVQNIHAEWQKAQQQVQSIQTAWEEAQQQVQQVYAVWGQAQQQAQEQAQRIQAEREQSLSQLQQRIGEWEKSREELQQVRAELEQARSLIHQMQTSKFWKFRNAFFRLKQAIGLANKD